MKYNFRLPKSHRGTVRDVNGTPHLSQLAADTHQRLLPNCRDRAQTLKLARAEVENMLRNYGNEFISAACDEYHKLGDKGAFHELIKDVISRSGAKRWSANRLREDVETVKRDPTLPDNLLSVINKLAEYVNKIEHPGLKAFEQKALFKYSSDSMKRNFEEYVRVVRRDYLDARKTFLNAPLPNMYAYDLALKSYYAYWMPLVDPAHPDGNSIRELAFTDVPKRTRDDSFGGDPYNTNQGNYLNDDLSDLRDYAVLYWRLAALWLLLDPEYKVKLADYYTYTALERVQHGGVLPFTHLNSLDELELKGNKQRFVQAESAIFPKALKPYHDILLGVWRAQYPLGADKVSESEVERAMISMAKQSLHLGIPLQGKDWTSYDSTIQPDILNDNYYNVLRAAVGPLIAWFVIDPYYKVSMTTPIFVPGVGLMRSTGIKSGQLITNQADCFNADFVDRYDQARLELDYEQD